MDISVNISALRALWRGERWSTPFQVQADLLPGGGVFGRDGRSLRMPDFVEKTRPRNVSHQAAKSGWAGLAPGTRAHDTQRHGGQRNHPSTSLQGAAV